MKKIKSRFITAVTFFLIVTVCGVFASTVKISANNFLGFLSGNSKGCSHNLETINPKEPSCTENGWYAYEQCIKCTYNTKVIRPSNGHDIYFSNEDSDVHLSCLTCGATYTPTTYYYLDGTSHEGMSGKGSNSQYYTVTPNTQLPSINENHYEYIKKGTTEPAQVQMWIPSEANGLNGLSSSNNAVGVLSFDLNAKMDEFLEIKLVEGHTSVRWQPEWAITNPILKLEPLIEDDGTSVYTLKGVNGEVIKTFEIDSTGYTGWFSVQIIIGFDPHNDYLLLNYYINGESSAQLVTDLTTRDNSITSVYLTGKTSSEGSGYMIDNILFGYDDNCLSPF